MEEVLKGLTDKQVDNNQKLYGKNIKTSTTKYNTISTIINIVGLIILPVVIIIIINLLKKEYLVAIIILISYLILIIVRLINNKINNKYMLENSELLNYKYTVIRNGEEKLIKSSEITIDDLLIVKEGERVPVDGLIVKAKNLYVKEFNNFVKKNTSLLNKNDILKSNYLYEGSLILKGTATIKITNIGLNTFFYLNKLESKNKMDKISNVVDIICIVIYLISLLVVIFTLDVYSGFIINSSILISVLLLNFSYTLKSFMNTYFNKALKYNIYVKNKKIIRKISKINYLCLNKENFITEGILKVKEIYSNNIPKDELLLNAILSNPSSKKGDMFDSINKYYNKEVTFNNLVKQYPYDEKNNLYASIYKFENKNHLFVSGDLESIFDICELDVEEKYRLHNFQKSLYKKGLVVIGIASKQINSIELDIFNYNIHFDGLIALYDFPKHGIESFIKEYNNKNIGTLIFTNDNKIISKALGENLGIDTEEILDDKIITESSDEELLNKLKKNRIFSKIKDKNKKRIIDLLEKNSLYTITTFNSLKDLINFENSSIKITLSKFNKSALMDFSDIILYDNSFNTFRKTMITLYKFLEKTKRLIFILSVLTFINLLTIVILSCVRIIGILPIILIIEILILNLKFLMYNKKK